MANKNKIPPYHDRQTDQIFIMEDQRKTKVQLLKEIQALRKQIAELKNDRTDRNSPENTDEIGSNNLTLQEDRYRLLFELSPGGIILEDDKGVILDVNEAFCKSLGYERKELVGKKVHILAHPEVQEQVDKNIATLLSGKKLRHNEKSVRKDGSICYMDLKETKVMLPDGRAGILCIAEDFTEHIRAQQEHMKREKLQGVLEMAGAVCHELNQPLTTIAITSDLIQDFPANENMEENVRVIKTEVARMGEITKKLMKITKYETRVYVNGSKIVDIDKASEQPQK